VLNSLVALFVEEPMRGKCKQLLVAFVNLHGNAKARAVEARMNEKMRRLTRLLSKSQVDHKQTKVLSPKADVAHTASVLPAYSFCFFPCVWFPQSVMGP
jgi:hypothetical protein